MPAIPVQCDKTSATTPQLAGRSGPQPVFSGLLTRYRLLFGLLLAVPSAVANAQDSSRSPAIQLAQGGPYGAPGGDPINGMRVGSPYYWSATNGAGAYGYSLYNPAGNAGGMGPNGYGGGDPYTYHFGPGVYRQAEAGHYRFPYYSYRRPWYFQGHTSYNRDTNLPW